MNDQGNITLRPDERAVDVTVVVVNYNTAHLLDRMFSALDAARGDLKLRVIVVDNASHDGSAAILGLKFPNVELIQNSVNVGFGRANNQALSRLKGRYLLLLNTDAFVAPDTLRKTVGFMDARPQCGVLGVRLVGEDGSFQPSCRYFPTPWNIFAASNKLGAWLRRQFFPSMRLVDDFSWDHASVRECDWVPGCYYLVRREVVERVGLFDPRYFLYLEEVDHCRRVREAGWSVVYYPTQVLHIGGVSAESIGRLTAGRQISALQIESKLLYFRKHHGVTGVLTAVFLDMVGNAISACYGLVWRWDTSRVTTAAQYAWTELGLLIATRLASRPTR